MDDLSDETALEYERSSSWFLIWSIKNSRSDIFMFPVLCLPLIRLSKIVR